MQWPEPRSVVLERDVAQEIADAFGLGVVHSADLSARGWVSLNVLWRVTTDSGRWAVKEIVRDSRDQLEAAAAIEMSAERAGVVIPKVRRALGGSVTVQAGGRVFRCHEFVDGDCLTGELREADAASVGAALARLHGAASAWDPVLMTETVFGEGHWSHLIDRGEQCGLPWANDVRLAMPGVLAAEGAAGGWWQQERVWVGSHRDVRPDNALRAPDASVLLVDWDGAGPVVKGREVAGALRWWHPHEEAFLAAYVEVAGDIDLEEGAGEDGTLGWWLEMNMRHALAMPSDSERSWAVSALASNFVKESLSDK